MDLQQLLTSLKRRWKFVVAVFLSGVVGALLISWTVTPMYESTVRVFFSAAGNTAYDDQIQLGMYTKQRAQSYAALAEDPVVLGKVVDRADVGATPEGLAERADLEVIADTVVLRVAVRDAEPGVARKLADAYAAEIGATVATLETPKATEDGKKPSSPIVARTQGGASVSSDPVSPRTSLNVAVGALLGLLFGIGGAVLREQYTSAHREEIVSRQADRPSPIPRPDPAPGSVATASRSAVTERFAGVRKAPVR